MAKMSGAPKLVACLAACAVVIVTIDCDKVVAVERARCAAHVAVDSRLPASDAAALASQCHPARWWE